MQNKMQLTSLGLKASLHDLAQKMIQPRKSAAVQMSWGLHNDVSLCMCRCCRQGQGGGLGLAQPRAEDQGIHGCPATGVLASAVSGVPTVLCTL